MSETDGLTIHTDGAARGNPGPAAFAFVISQPGQADVEEHGCLGDTTNNVAEYTALVRALERAQQLGGRKLVVLSDSELMVKQMLGLYKVKNEGLRPLYEEATQLAAKFDKVSFRHVRREQNRRADELCNESLDGAAPTTQKKAVHRSAAATAGPRKTVTLPPGAHAEILQCLRTVATVWVDGKADHPRAEEVWDQLWTILEDAGVLKTTQR